MAKFLIADEINDSYTADVLPSGALETASVYQYAYLNSAAAGVGSITTVPAILHSISITNTATASSAVLHICNCLSSTASAMATATTVTRIGLANRGTYLFDAYCGTQIAYYLAGQDCDGITVTYQIGG
jgi:hypothetical protein